MSVTHSRNDQIIVVPVPFLHKVHITFLLVLAMECCTLDTMRDKPISEFINFVCPPAIDQDLTAGPSPRQTPSGTTKPQNKESSPDQSKKICKFPFPHIFHGTRSNMFNGEMEVWAINGTLNKNTRAKLE
jgi:hypothetical protein